MTKQIPLTQGKFALVDDEDYDFLIKRKWLYNGGYAKSNQPMIDCVRGQLESMHRIINQTPAGMATDHINGNTLDNRKCNLRTCSTQENNRNSKTPDRPKTSKYKGVFYEKSRNKWRAQIRPTAGKKVTIGRFISEYMAAVAYNDAAVKYFGEFARLNQLSSG